MMEYICSVTDAASSAPITYELNSNYLGSQSSPQYARHHTNSHSVQAQQLDNYTHYMDWEMTLCITDSTWVTVEIEDGWQGETLSSSLMIQSEKLLQMMVSFLIQDNDNCIKTPFQSSSISYNLFCEA
tara:strand:+ start:3677 stop:4060 length:384 start_codon:yes stop_codon:yes gene_type:complete